MPTSDGKFTPHEFLMQRIEWALNELESAMRDDMPALQDGTKQPARHWKSMRRALVSAKDTLLETRGALGAYHTSLTRDQVYVAPVKEMPAGAHRS